MAKLVKLSQAVKDALIPAQLRILKKSLKAELDFLTEELSDYVRDGQREKACAKQQEIDDCNLLIQVFFPEGT